MAQLVEVSDGLFRLTGKVNFANVPGLWAGSRQIFPKLKSEIVKFDVNDITQIDSGGLAFLVSWARWANFYGKKFYIIGENSQLKALVESNQLQTLLKAQT